MLNVEFPFNTGLQHTSWSRMCSETRVTASELYYSIKTKFVNNFLSSPQCDKATDSPCRFLKYYCRLKLLLGRRVAVGWSENVTACIRLSASPSHQGSSHGGWDGADRSVDMSDVADVTNHEAPSGSVGCFTLSSPTSRVVISGRADRRSYALPPHHSIQATLWLGLAASGHV